MVARQAIILFSSWIALAACSRTLLEFHDAPDGSCAGQCGGAGASVNGTGASSTAGDGAGGSATGGGTTAGAPSGGFANAGGAATGGGAAEGGFGAMAPDASAGGSGPIDCSVVGCAPPTFCGAACDAPCGCCPCAEGQTWSPGSETIVCAGGCWASLLDSGGPAAPVSCQGTSDCPSSQYCGTQQLCLSYGTCTEASDCEAADNVYPRPRCRGLPLCNAGLCDYVCGRGSLP